MYILKSVKVFDTNNPNTVISTDVDKIKKMLKGVLITNDTIKGVDVGKAKLNVLSWFIHTSLQT